MHDDPNGGAFNPYAPPTEAADVPFRPEREPGQAELSPRGKRLLGAIIDSLLGGLVLGMAFVTESDSLELTGWIVGGVVALIQTVLIATSGQSIAKKMLGMRIIRMNGAPVDFMSGVLLRSWLPTAIGIIPWVGNLFGIADAIFIFNEDHRCIHDRIADTQVVEV